MEVQPFLDVALKLISLEKLTDELISNVTNRTMSALRFERLFFEDRNEFFAPCRILLVKQSPIRSSNIL